jgi:ankyrin repeat protein
VEDLLNGGASPNIKDSNGETALFHAISCRQVKNIELFVKFGAIFY